MAASSDIRKFRVELVGALPIISPTIFSMRLTAGWARQAGPICFSAASWGIRRLKMEAGLRRWRLFSVRYAKERVWVERWLHMVSRSLAKQPGAASEIVQTATMIHGYGDVYRQGLADWHAIIDGLAKPTFDGVLALPDLARAVAGARAAALRTRGRPRSSARSPRSGRASPPAPALRRADVFRHEIPSQVSSGCFRCACNGRPEWRRSIPRNARSHRSRAYPGRSWRTAGAGSYSDRARAYRSRSCPIRAGTGRGDGYRWRGGYVAWVHRHACPRCNPRCVRRMAASSGSIARFRTDDAARLRHHHRARPATPAVDGLKLRDGPQRRRVPGAPLAACGTDRRSKLTDERSGRGPRCAPYHQTTSVCTRVAAAVEA